MMAYRQSTKWKKLRIYWNTYQENTTSIGFQFRGPKQSRKLFYTFV